MTGWVRGRALPPSAFAEHFFDRGPDSPGVRPLHEAAKALGDASSFADLRAASDHVAESMREIGPDSFHALVRDAVGRAEQPLPRAPTVIEKGPENGGPPRRFLVPVLPTFNHVVTAGVISAVNLFLDWLAERNQQATKAEVEAAMERFGIGAGSGKEEVAKALLEAEKKQPGLLRRAAAGDAEALATVREVMGGREAPGEGIETWSEEERTLVREMVAAGYDNRRSARRWKSTGPRPRHGRGGT